MNTSQVTTIQGGYADSLVYNGTVYAAFMPFGVGDMGLQTITVISIDDLSREGREIFSCPYKKDAKNAALHVWDNALILAVRYEHGPCDLYIVKILKFSSLVGNFRESSVLNENNCSITSVLWHGENYILVYYYHSKEVAILTRAGIQSGKRFVGVDGCTYPDGDCISITASVFSKELYLFVWYRTAVAIYVLRRGFVKIYELFFQGVDCKKKIVFRISRRKHPILVTLSDTGTVTLIDRLITVGYENKQLLLHEKTSICRFGDENRLVSASGRDLEIWEVDPQCLRKDFYTVNFVISEVVPLKFKGVSCLLVVGADKAVICSFPPEHEMPPINAVLTVQEVEARYAAVIAQKMLINDFNDFNYIQQLSVPLSPRFADGKTITAVGLARSCQYCIFSIDNCFKVLKLSDNPQGGVDLNSIWELSLPVMRIYALYLIEIRSEWVIIAAENSSKGRPICHVYGARRTRNRWWLDQLQGLLCSKNTKLHSMAYRPGLIFCNTECDDMKSSEFWISSNMEGFRSLIEMSGFRFQSMAFSPDHQRLLTVDYSRKVRIFDVSAMRLHPQSPAAPSASSLVAPDSRMGKPVTTASFSVTTVAWFSSTIVICGIHGSEKIRICTLNEDSNTLSVLKIISFTDNPSYIQNMECNGRFLWITTSAVVHRILLKA